MVSLKDLRSRLNVVLKYRQLSYKNFPENVIFKLLSFMFELTPTGFETYIAEYLKNISHFDISKVIWWYKDKGIDIRAEKNWQFYAIQCKKFGASHITQKEILDFIENTRELKKKYGGKITLYLRTSSRINKYAKNIAKQNWIEIRDYKSLLKLEKEFPINDFIKKYKWDGKILSGIDTEDVLNTFYLRKWIKRWWLADTLYFILKNTLFRFSDYYVDYQKIEKNTKGEKTPYYSFLQKESPIAGKNTFVWEVK